MKNSSFLFIFFICLLLWSCSSTTPTATQIESKNAPEVKSLTINEHNFHYIDLGKGEPVVFVHGSLGDYRTWSAQIDTFAKHYRVIAYSRRYAYPNDQTLSDSSDYSVKPHAKDLAEFLKALNLGPAHLVGHSYGAFTVLSAALAHPELVRSLTLGEPPVMSLLSGVPGGDTLLNNFILQAMVPASELFKANDSVAAVRKFIAGVMGDSMYFDKIPDQGREIMMANTLEIKGAMGAENAFPLVSCDDLKKITAPVLLVKGEKSPLLFVSITSEIQRCVTNSRTATLANASHGLEFENPADFNKAVLEFIAEH